MAEELVKRKSKLIFETPFEFRGRAMIVDVKPWGLELRLKARHKGISITWGAIWTQANIIEGNRIRAERKKRKPRYALPQ